MPWKPTEPGEVPTLGYIALDFMSEMLAEPDRPDYSPFLPYREQEDFILEWYRIDPLTGRFIYRRGLLGRPRGWGKSPLLAALAITEFVAPIVFAGWDSEGQPVGRPWSDIRTAIVHVAAVSEEQTKNTWEPVLQMLEGPVSDEYGLDPMEGMVTGPHHAKMLPRTASARTIKGGRPIFSVLDQTEEWIPSNGGVRLANTMRSNAAKVGGRTLESPNAFVPGEESVAEASAAFALAISEGRAKDPSLLYDHREASGQTDVTDRESLIAGLRYAYGDSVRDYPCIIHEPSCERQGHVDLEPLLTTIWDPAQDLQISRSDFLNQITHASDQWVSSPVWAARRMGQGNIPDKIITTDEPIVLGFDGSRGRNRGKADATALVGCRVSDGHLFTIRVWEQPSGPMGKDWVPNAIEVDAEVRSCMTRYKVVGFYADPSGWSEYVAAWTAAFGRRLKVKASQENPIAAWPRGKDSRVVEYVERLRLAIVNGECTHDGSSELTRHIINARKRNTRSGVLLYKSYPDSPYKIDAAYAATMAWKARTDAIAKGIGRGRTARGKVTVLR